MPSSLTSCRIEAPIFFLPSTGFMRCGLSRYAVLQDHRPSFELSVSEVLEKDKIPYDDIALTEED
jgi:hypothetical protein